MPGPVAPLTDVTAAILAGGLGTRLGPMAGDRPKVLAPVGGRPFLARLLDQLADAGVRRAVLCTGHRGDEVAAACGTEHRGIRLACAREPAPRGTAGAIRAALPLLVGDPILVLNGDSFCRLDFAALRSVHESYGAAGTLALVPAEDTARYGRVRTGPGGVVEALEEKLPAAGPGWINAGVYLLGRRLIESIPPDRPVSLEREILPAWIGRGLHGCPGDWPFIDIGTPASYAAAEAFFAGL